MGAGADGALPAGGGDAGLSDTAAKSDFRVFGLARFGAIKARFTEALLQLGQVRNPLFCWSSKAAELANQPSNSWLWSQMS